MTGTLYNFFGTIEVSHVNVFMAIMCDYPDWLRGISNEKKLPRRVSSLDLPYKFIAPDNAGDLAARLCWIIEHLSGSWNSTQTWIFIEDEEDAMHYRLTWE